MKSRSSRSLADVLTTRALSKSGGGGLLHPLMVGKAMQAMQGGIADWRQQAEASGHADEASMQPRQRRMHADEISMLPEVLCVC